jgi:hypothetical protein
VLITERDWHVGLRSYAVDPTISLESGEGTERKHHSVVRVIRLRRFGRLHDSGILLFLLGVRCPNFFSLASSARGRLSLPDTAALFLENVAVFRRRGGNNWRNNVKPRIASPLDSERKRALYNSGSTCAERQAKLPVLKSSRAPVTRPSIKKPLRRFVAGACDHALTVTVSLFQ